MVPYCVVSTQENRRQHVVFTYLLHTCIIHKYNTLYFMAP